MSDCTFGRMSCFPKRVRRARAALVAMLTALSTIGAPAMAQSTGDPPVPPGRDPGGIAIALVSAGLDYTHADIRDRLARDGEGQIVALDLVDGDNRPYAASDAAIDPGQGGNGTELARQLLAVYRHARLVPIRVDALKPHTVAQAVAFAARTPARIIALPFWSPEKGDWGVLELVSVAFPDHLLVLAGGQSAAAGGRKPYWPAALDIGNTVIAAPHAEVAGGQLRHEAKGPHRIDALMLGRGGAWFGPIARPVGTPGEAVALAAGLAACAHHNQSSMRPDALKARLLALAVRREGPHATAVLDPLCLYGGQRY